MLDYQEAIKTVYQGLDELQEKAVFTGGTTVPFYLTTDSPPPPRPTRDVDFVVQVASRAAYVHLQERLRELGFREDVESKVICRWKYKEIIVDIMPTEGDILGFANQWHKLGMSDLWKVSLDEGCTINLFSSVYFLASKLAAMQGREGGMDIRYSQDFEDIVSLLQGRKELEAEVNAAGEEVKDFIRESMEKLLSNRLLQEAISVQTEYEQDQEELMELIERISSL